MYGDIIETLVLWLARQAGHEVKWEQKEVSIDGVTGHIDAVIDGVLADLKSCSPFSYKKFRVFCREHRDADFILWNGNRARIKRAMFEKYLDNYITVL